MKNKKISRLISLTVMFAMLCSLTVFAEDTSTDIPDSAPVEAVMELIGNIGNVTVYTANKIKEARNAYDALEDSQKENVENISLLTDAEAELEAIYLEVADTDHTVIYQATKQYIESLGTPGVGSVGGEWMVICLTRSDSVCPEGYYDNVVEFVNENINDKEQLHRAKSTENSRVILALTSAGYDVTDVDGHNLLEGLSDMTYLKKQGVNGPIWALIALDSYGYEIPQNEKEETQATREGIISYILEKQLSDGGWSIYGRVADPDMTGMAIQALAPYCATNPEVENAVGNALNCLSELQHENGGFGSIDGLCSESCAQVIVALNALGIDPETDERFIKNGISVIDAMCIFAIEGGGFEHVPYSGLNGMATEQGQYALTSYIRFLEGKTRLYDMTDVAMYSEEIPEEDEEPEDDDEYYDDEDEYYDDEYYDDEYYEDEYYEDEYYEESTETDSHVAEEDVLQESEETVAEEQPEIAEEKEIEKAEKAEKNTYSEDTFTDVKKDQWYYESVKYVYENNLMQGADNQFEPESKLTRAMLVTVLYRMANPKDEEYSHTFEDVPQDAWYCSAVSWASQNNLVNGVSENRFAPEEDITREQIALIFYRFAKMNGLDVSCDSNIEKYTDINDISDWASEAVVWANSVSLMGGTSNSTFSPKETATRAQVATILMRLQEKVFGGIKGSEMA